MARSIDGTDVDIRLFVGCSQENGYRIVDDGRRFNIINALTVQRFLQQVIDHLALNARRSKFLRPDDEFSIVKIRLFRGEREGVTQEILFLMVAVNGFIYEFSDEIKHFLSRGICADEIVYAFHLQRLSHLFEHFELAFTHELNPQNTQVRAAEVQCQIFAGFLAGGQAQIGLEHTQRRFVRILESQTQIITEISGNFPELLAVHREFINKLCKMFLIKSHFLFPFNIFLMEIPFLL